MAQIATNESTCKNWKVKLGKIFNESDKKISRKVSWPRIQIFK